MVLHPALDDPLVSFDTTKQKYIYEDDEGHEHFYDEDLQKWVFSDADLLEQQQKAYEREGVDTAIDSRDQIKQAQKKRKERDRDTDLNANKSRKLKENTAVYATNLPRDITFAAINSLFSKYGVINEDVNTNLPRIKMYEDENGQAKGDALIVYYRPESVSLAIQMLDDTELAPGYVIRVQPADLAYKKEKNDDDDVHNGKSKVPDKLDKSKPRSDKKKLIKTTQKMQSKLAEWDSDDDGIIQTSGKNALSKSVILKHMFTLKEIEEDPKVILEVKEDVRDECAKLGSVTNVVLYDQEEEGVVSVRFSDHDAAKLCVQVMHGRYFGGDSVVAELDDGRIKYRKSRNTDDIENENEEGGRLDKFGEWLEKES